MNKEYLIVVIGLFVAAIPWLIALLRRELRFIFPSRKDYLNASKESYRLFIKSIRDAKTSVVATFGEVDFRLYMPIRKDGDTTKKGQLYQAFVEALERKVTVEVFCGPEIVVPNEYKEEIKPKKIPKETLCEMNGIIKLALDGAELKDEDGSYKKVILYRSSKRENNHFRLTDGKHVYLEKYHEPLIPTESCWEIKNSVFFTRKLKREIRRLKNDCKKCSNMEDILNNFNFMTEQEINEQVNNKSYNI